MWVYAITVLLLGISMLFIPEGSQQQRDIERVHAMSANFAYYRAAVNDYAHNNPAANGVIPDASLSLSPTWNNTGSWQNQIDSGLVYVFGEIDEEGLVNLLKELKFPASIGRKIGGNLVTAAAGDTGFGLPAFIPDGSVVSMVYQ